ncbi:MAG: hypothetical protein WB542_06280 [Polaromonas sp.]
MGYHGMLKSFTGLEGPSETREPVIMLDGRILSIRRAIFRQLSRPAEMNKQQSLRALQLQRDVSKVNCLSPASVYSLIATKSIVRLIYPKGIP